MQRRQQSFWMRKMATGNRKTRSLMPTKYASAMAPVGESPDSWIGSILGRSYCMQSGLDHTLSKSTYGMLLHVKLVSEMNSTRVQIVKHSRMSGKSTFMEILPGCCHWVSKSVNSACSTTLCHVQSSAEMVSNRLINFLLSVASPSMKPFLSDLLFFAPI